MSPTLLTFHVQEKIMKELTSIIRTTNGYPYFWLFWRAFFTFHAAYGSLLKAVLCLIWWKVRPNSNRISFVFFLLSSTSLKVSLLFSRKSLTSQKFLGTERRKKYIIYVFYMCTGKSFSEALILASVNPQYDERLLTEFQEKYNLTTCCVQILFWMSKQKQNSCHIVG